MFLPSATGFILIDVFNALGATSLVTIVYFDISKLLWEVSNGSSDPSGKPWLSTTMLSQMGTLESTGKTM